MTEFFNRHSSDVKLNAVPGAGRANPERVGTGGTEFGFSFSSYAYQAFKGQEPFKKAFPELRGVIKLWESAYHQYAGKEVVEGGIRSWADIVKSPRPLRLGVGSRGTSTDEFNRNILAFYKIGYDDLRKRGFTLTHVGVDANSQAFQARQIDFYFHNAGVPNAAGIQATIGRPTIFLDMPAEVVKHLAKFGLVPATIPANTYKGQDKPVHTVGDHGFLLTTTKMEPATVYSLLKIMHENKTFLVGVHGLFKRMDPKTSWKGISIPLHEGARRFYTEQGVRLP